MDIYSSLRGSLVFIFWSKCNCGDCFAHFISSHFEDAFPGSCIFFWDWFSVVALFVKFEIAENLEIVGKV
ncbi:uncharacterized protein EAF02_002073 [Botrytis sinoallii]|uniref:uncharacterized protein n=1 Tax=Botrytis sinoallii TaxID=1463999 RepID=UPI0019029E41|nr:uncharacterized protein EAF02_002073 [Botrytis sinoallii]KAF7889658.1 hypothetical protein EAF02_002073 [Botrytis sinoallii]